MGIWLTSWLFSGRTTSHGPIGFFKLRVLGYSTANICLVVVVRYSAIILSYSYLRMSWESVLQCRELGQEAHRIQKPEQVGTAHTALTLTLSVGSDAAPDPNRNQKNMSTIVMP